MSRAEELFRAADPAAGTNYVPSRLDAMCRRVVSQSLTVPRHRWSAHPRGTRLAVSIAIVLGLGGAAAGAELAVGSGFPSPKAALNRQLNSVIAKYGRAVSTRSSQSDCNTIGLAAAKGDAEAAGQVTLIGNWTSDVAAIDGWLFNESVPTRPGSNPLGDFNELTDGSAPTSVCYFEGPYGEQISTPIRSMPAGSIAVDIVLVTSNHAYIDNTLPYPVPPEYSTPPAAS
jgi:hypothetical protein